LAAPHLPFDEVFAVPRLAIVISAFGSIESLEATLVSVLENRPSDSEIVVALKRPYADPYELKDEVRFVAPRRRTSCMAAINAALATTRAPFIHVLASGCQVSEGWTEAALSRFGDRRVAAVVPWVWDAQAEHRLYAAGIGYRRRGQRHLVGAGQSADAVAETAATIGPGLFAAFYRKAALDLAGGFSQQLGPRQADADLALIFKQAGFALAVEPRSQITALTDIDAGENAFSEALSSERLFWRNQLGRGSKRALISHLGNASWDVLRALPWPTALARIVGRSWASLELGSHARHRALLRELANRAVQPQPVNEHLRIDRSHESPARAENNQARVRSK
jgi:hypothetical protein